MMLKGISANRVRWILFRAATPPIWGGRSSSQLRGGRERRPTSEQGADEKTHRGRRVSGEPREHAVFEHGVPAWIHLDTLGTTRKPPPTNRRCIDCASEACSRRRPGTSNCTTFPSPEGLPARDRASADTVSAAEQGPTANHHQVCSPPYSTAEMDC